MNKCLKVAAANSGPFTHVLMLLIQLKSRMTAAWKGVKPRPLPALPVAYMTL
jgi:hypothetical protein